jgi:HEAT repeat protein
MALGKAQALDSYAAIQKLVKDRNPVVAESAVLALGMMGHRRSLPFLLGMAINKKQSTRNRVHAVISLGLVGDEASCRKLADLALRSNDEDEVKAACLIALSLLRDEPAGALFIGRLAAERVRPALKAVAATALGKLGCKELRFARRPVVTVKYLAHLLRTQKKNAQLRQSAALALGALDLASEVDPQQLLRVIAPALDDSDWDTANFTLMAVAEIGRGGHGGDAAWSLIRRRLRRRDHAVLGYACIATGLSRDRDSIPTLRRLLTSGPSPGIRAAAAIGLGLMGDMGATPAMLKIINGKGDTVLRGYCCTALGIMNISKNDEALPTIKRVLRTESAPDLRAAAAMALARVGDRDALDTLLASLKDGNQYFRMSAVVAIGSFRHLRAVGPLMELFKAKNVNNELRAIICVALGNIAEPTSVPNFRLARFQILLQIVRLL